MKVTRPFLIMRNLEQVAQLEAEAVRVFSGPAGRLFEMADGRLVTVHNEQPAGSRVAHLQWPTLISREDAEDYYGWTAR